MRRVLFQEIRSRINGTHEWRGIREDMYVDDTAHVVCGRIFFFQRVRRATK